MHYLLTHDIYRERLRRDVRSVTPSKVPEIAQRRHALRRRLVKFRALQAIYIPLALAVLAEDAKCRLDVEDVENVRLGLPSDIKSAHRARVCSARLQDIEVRLREAQCRDALHTIRNKLHSISYLYKYKAKNVRHQGANTRSRSDIAKQEARKDRAVAEYRRARRAKFALSGPGSWEREFRILHDADIRHVADDDNETARRKKKQKKPDGPAEGRRKVSWIWCGADADGDEGVTDSLRLEWSKSRSRKLRWGEEIGLVPEEMRRTLVTLEYEELVWKYRETARTVLDPHLAEGLVAYADDQVRIRRAMRATFRAVCRPIVARAGGAIAVEFDVDTQNDVRDVNGDEFDDVHEDMVAMYELDGEDIGMTSWA